MLQGTVKGDIHARERLVSGGDSPRRGTLLRVIEMTVGAQIKGKLVRLAPEARAGPEELSAPEDVKWRL